MARIDSVSRLLLICNSTLHGSGYLDHAEAEIRDLLGSSTQVVFIPFALHDRKSYSAKAGQRFLDMGFSLTSIHDISNMPRAIAEADAIFVGGGNTFRLLTGLCAHDLLGPIRRRVAAGAPISAPVPAQLWRALRSKRPRTCQLCNLHRSRRWAWFHSRSARTTWTPTPRPPTWERPRRSESCSSWRKTRSQSLGCGKAQCSE